MLRVCSFPGCETLTLGVTCIVHEVQARRPLPVGRPFPRHLTPVPMTGGYLDGRETGGFESGGAGIVSRDVADTRCILFS